MPDYRRARIPGANYFFTVVTHRRRPLFAQAAARRCLGRAWRRACDRAPFRTVGVCLLPDHLHCIWTLPPGDADYAGRWKLIKGSFTRAFRRLGGGGGATPLSRRRKGEAAVWQRRYWEHWIRDEADLRRHLDYIHYNPVKHELAQAAAEWPWSSFHRYVKEGAYPPDWGTAEPPAGLEGLDAGE